MPEVLVEIENWLRIRVRANTINVICLDPGVRGRFYGGFTFAGTSDGISIKLQYQSPPPAVRKRGNETGGEAVGVA